MKVRNMTSPRSGNPVANQFLITDEQGNHFFQSYGVLVAKEERGGLTLLDEKYYDYSNTTIKYRNQFLNLDSKEVKAKIKSGEILLTNLNN